MRKVMNPAFSIRNLTARRCLNLSLMIVLLMRNIETEMYYDTTDVLVDFCLSYHCSDHIHRLIDVLTRQINGQEKPSEGKEILMYEWGESLRPLEAGKNLTECPSPVSKATLDIICDTAFGYKTNSLVNPDNELAKSYRELLDMQSCLYILSFVCVRELMGSACTVGNFFKLIILGVTPGLPKIMSSNLAYKYRTWLSKILPCTPDSNCYYILD